MNKHKKLLIIILSLVILNLFFWFRLLSFTSFKSSVSYLPVGQGDSELIQTKAGNILIDAGPDATIVSSLGQSLNFSDRTIDVFILTNQDTDHFGGFNEVIKNYKVRSVMINNSFANSARFKDFLEKVKSLNIPVILAASGAEIDLSDNEKLSVIYPDKAIDDTKLSKNETSVVIDLNLYNHEFLFTSDIDFKVENKIKSLLLPSYDVLKVAHHGSKTSTSLDFLKTINPKFSVIEVGKNNYGHPTQELLSRLDEIGSQVFRTDLDGMIKFIVNKYGELGVK